MITDFGTKNENVENANIQDNSSLTNKKKKNINERKAQIIETQKKTTLMFQCDPTDLITLFSQNKDVKDIESSSYHKIKAIVCVMICFEFC